VATHSTQNTDGDVFFAMAVDPMCVARMDGSFKKVNPALSSTLGYSEETLLSSNFLDFVHPDDVSRTVLEMSKISAGGAAKEFENRYRTCEGRYVVLSWSCAPPKANGDVFAVARDVTETHRVRRELVESERRYRSIVEGSNDLINVLDAQGRFQFTNHAARTVYGVEPEACVGLSYAEFIHPDDHGDTVRAVEGWAAARIPHAIYENRQVRKDGEVRLIAWNVAMHYDDGGDLETIIAIGRDITEKKRTEDALRAALDTAREASRAKTMFLASTSHELRTPLNAILGFSDMIRSATLVPLSPAKIQEYAEDIHRSGAFLLDLVDDILDISSVEQNKVLLKKASFDMTALVDEIVKETKFLAQTKNIDVAVCCDAPKIEIFADRIHIKRTLSNLQSNALKFTPPNGAVTLTLTDASADVHLSIADTGPGISRADLDKVTEPFVRGHADPHISGGGWGLGLAIAKALVDLHDGRLSIDSVIGAGTTVRVRLPKAAAS